MQELLLHEEGAGAILVSDAGGPDPRIFASFTDEVLEVPHAALNRSMLKSALNIQHRFAVCEKLDYS